MKINITPRTPCPSCGAPLDRVSAADGDDATPRPDDLTICLHCATALQYDDQLQLHILTRAARAALPTATRNELHQAQLKVQLLRLRAGKSVLAIRPGFSPLKKRHDHDDS